MGLLLTETCYCSRFYSFYISRDKYLILVKLLASNGTIQVFLDLIKDCKLDNAGRKTLLPIVIDTLSLLLCDCTLASEKMIKSQGYEKLFTEVNGLGPPDPVVLKSILAMATHGQVCMIIVDYA